MCTIAEAIGMTAAATAAKTTQGLIGEPATAREGIAALTIVVAGGLIEGLALGGFQSAALMRWLPGLNRARWILVTTVVAGLGWAAASAPSALSGPGDGSAPPMMLVLFGAAGLGVAMGAVLGAAQAAVLRGRVRHPRRWIGAIAAAWAPTMTIIFIGATLPGENWSVAAVVVTGTVTGLTAGAALGLVTWSFLPTLDGGPMHNRIAVRLLDSPVRRLLGTSLAALRVTGMLTGQIHELPVQYAVADHGLVVLPAHAETKRWWRNLEEPADLQVLIRGGWVHGVGVALRPGDRGYPSAVATYRTRWPRVRISDADPIVLITIRAERAPSHVGAAAGG